MDSENAPMAENKLGFGFIPIRARISDDADEDYEGDIEEEGSYPCSESYDSASEPMDSTCETDTGDPVTSFNEPFSFPEAACNAQEGALMQLNQLNTGLASLDTSLLENIDQEGFRNRVLNIAKTNGVSPDDHTIHSILNALLPLAGKGAMGSMSAEGGEMHPMGEFSKVIPIAKLTAEDDDDSDGLDEESQEICQTDSDNGAIHSGHSGEDNLLGSARGLRIRVRCSDEESREHEDNPIVPTTSNVSALSSSLFSGQEDATIDCGENDGSVNLPSPSSSRHADVKKEGQLSLLQENSQIAFKAEEENSAGKSSAPDSCGSVVNTVSSSDDSVQASPSFRSSLKGEQNRGRGLLDSKVGLDAPLDMTGYRQQDLFQNGQSDGKRESGDFKEKQVVESDSSTIVPEDTMLGNLIVNQGGIDLPGSAFVDLESSVDGQPETNLQKMADLGDRQMGSKPVPVKLQFMDEERTSMPAAEGKENLEREFKNSAFERKADTEEGSFEATIDDDENHNDLIDSALPVAESVSSKSTADPASDTPSLGGAGHSLAVRPFGLGRFTPSLEHAPRSVQRSLAASASSSLMERECSNGDLSRGNQEVGKKLQTIRVKFLRLAHRLGQPPHNAVIAQVLYRLGLAEQLREVRGMGRPGSSSLERAGVLAEEQEAAGQDGMDFVCTMMLLGKSGVGKSATINSLFDEVKAGTDAYSPATKKVQVVTGMVHGIKLKIIDTPGLLSSFVDQRHNRRILSSVRQFIKKSPPDIVLYFDRLDMQSRDYGDLPLLQTITETFGAAVWFNAIVAFTHAASAPPDGTNGVPINYEMYVAQRSHVVQQMIRQAAGDTRLMNPVSLIENHSACRTNRTGQKVLPNGHVWKPQLLLLCFASKILAEANSLLKLQDTNPAKALGVRGRGPPLPYLLSSMLQSRAKLRMPDDQGGDDEDSDGDSEGNSDGEEDYDDLPPFRRLTREELKLLDKEQRKVYAEELEDRERLFMKKQLKEERKRRKERIRRPHLTKEVSESAEDQLEEENSPSLVSVPMPDMALPPSFSSDNPTYRYRFLESPNQWLIRPVLETHGWDHDSGYDGLNVEKLFVIFHRIPASVSGQLTKDKKEANVQMECAASFQNGDGKATLAGLDVQTIGRDLAYTVRSETMFSNFRKNKTTCGLAVTMHGDTVATGVKIEDKLQIGRRIKVLVNTGALTGKGDVAYGGSLEASIRSIDHPVDRSCSSVGLSIMNWHGDLAIGGNLLVQIQLGKNLYIGRANLNNRGAGQLSLRMSSSEHVQIALVGLIPLVRAFINGKVLNTQGLPQ